MYLRQPKLPKLVIGTFDFESGPNHATSLTLRWETPNNMPFPMPIDVEINGKTQRLEMKDGKGSVTFTGATPLVDPKGWVLKAQ